MAFSLKLRREKTIFPCLISNPFFTWETKQAGVSIISLALRLQFCSCVMYLYKLLQFNTDGKKNFD